MRIRMRIQVSKIMRIRNHNTGVAGPYSLNQETDPDLTDLMTKIGKITQLKKLVPLYDHEISGYSFFFTFVLLDPKMRLASL